MLERQSDVVAMAPEDLSPRQLIDTRISESGAITFAEFMAISLYSDNGYYGSGNANIGDDKADRERHFTTSPETHPLFGASLGNGIHSMWQTLGKPKDFQVVEMGAGNGTMARDILAHAEQSHPDLYQAINYRIVEIAPGMIQKQREKLKDKPVSWVNASASQHPIEGVTGVFVSNELPDAFPVHRLMNMGGKPSEIFVTSNAAGELVETHRSLSPEIADSFYTSQLRGMPDQVEVTASPTMREWQHGLGRALHRGYAITIDYAAEDPRSYLPRTYGGTPRDMYHDPGTVDITTSINADAMVASGKESGLTVITRTIQSDLLRRFGIEEELDKIKSDPGDVLSFLGRTGTRMHHTVNMWNLAASTKEQRPTEGFPSFAAIVQSKNSPIPGILAQN